MRLAALLTAILLAGGAAAQAPASNVVSSVEVREAGGAVTIAIQGSRPPSFTTFSMMDPPRFVVDVSEAVFQGVPEEMRGRGNVKAVRNLSFGSGPTAVARVTVVFDGEVEPPDVRSEGTALVVRVAQPPAAPAAVARAETPPTPAAAAPAAAAAAVDAKAAAAAEKARAEEQARIAAEQAQKAALADAVARQESERAEAAARAEAEARARADAEARRSAEIAAAAAAAEKARQAGDAKVAATAGADKARRAEEEKAAAAEKARQAEEAKVAAKAAAAEKARQAEEAKAAARAAAAEKARQAEEAKVAARAAAAEKARLAEEAKAASRAAAAEKARAAKEARVAAAAEARSGRPNTVESLGFRQLPDVSQVFVRTRGVPRFRVSEAADNVVRVEMPNTQVPNRNDLNFLDTSFFPSAVATVTPMRVGRSYVVEIRLRQKVAWQQRVEGETLALDFERPASLRPAEPAPGAAAPAGRSPGEIAAPPRPSGQ